MRFGSNKNINKYNTNIRIANNLMVELIRHPHGIQGDLDSKH